MYGSLLLGEYERIVEVAALERIAEHRPGALGFEGPRRREISEADHSSAGADVDRAHELHELVAVSVSVPNENELH